MARYPTYLPTDFVKQDDKQRFKSYLDGFKPLGSDYEPTKAAPDLFTEAARIAREKGYDDDAGRVVQAILRTEGALSGEIGDAGKSHGPYQFHEGGMLPAYAKALGMDVRGAAEHARKNPTHAIGWALGGYLGNAIREGQAKGLRGAELATYAQQYGQRSQAPERAGQNYSAMFGGGAPIPAHAPTAIGPREAAIPAHTPVDDKAEFGKYLSSFPELGSDLQMGKERAIPAHEPKDDKQAFGEFLDSFPKLGGDLLGGLGQAIGGLGRGQAEPEPGGGLNIKGGLPRGMFQTAEQQQQQLDPYAQAGRQAAGRAMEAAAFPGELAGATVAAPLMGFARPEQNENVGLLGLARNVAQRGLGEGAAKSAEYWREDVGEAVPGMKFAAEMAFDPLNLAPGPKVIGRVGEVAGQAIKQVPELAGKALPEAGRLAKQGAKEYFARTADMPLGLGTKQMESLMGVKNYKSRLNPDAVELATESGLKPSRTSVPQVPALHVDIPWQQGQVNVELGAGKWMDSTDYLAFKGVKNLTYDKYALSPEHNARVLAEARANPPHSITVPNVLNVIETPQERQGLIKLAAELAGPDTPIYLSFHQGTGKGEAVRTLRDTWQENRKAASYLPEIQQVFPGARLEKGYIVAGHSPKALSLPLGMAPETVGGAIGGAYEYATTEGLSPEERARRVALGIGMGATGGHVLTKGARGKIGLGVEDVGKGAGTKGALPEGVRYNPKLASEARALPDGTIEVGPKYWNLPNDEARRLVVAHERAHGVGLEEAAFKDDEFWRLMQQEEMFGPIDPETGQIMRGINGAFKPGENVTEAYVLLNEQPQWLKEHYPKAYKYVAELAQREGIPVSQVVADDVKAMTPPPAPIKEPLTKPPAIKGKGEKVEQPKTREAAETVAEEGAEQGVQQVQGDEAGVPRVARRPLWEIAGTTAEPPFIRAEPPQGPRRPTDAGWTPSGREPGGAGKMQPYTPPDPLEQLEQAFAKPKQTTKDTLLAAKDKFVRATYDRIQPFKFVERKTGIPVHKLGQVVSGAAAAGEDNIARYILPAIKPVGKNVKALERYMVLRRMEDILARSPKAKLPGGLNGWQGQIGALKLLRNQLGEEQFKVVEQAAEELWRLNDELMLKPKLEAGFISQETYTKLRSTHPHYIDFHRAEFAVEPAAGQLPAGRRVASISDAGIDRMVDAGSDLALDEPLARFAAQAIDTQVRISRNRAARALVEALTQIERESGTQLVKLGETATTIDRAPIYYFENGQMVTAQVPKVYADAAKALEAEPANAVFDFLGKAAMPLRAGAVTLNTAFIPVNIIRDTFSAWLREGLVPFSAEYNRGFIAAVTRNTDFRDAAQAGTLMSGFVESMRTTESMAAARRVLGGIKVDNVMDALLVIPRLIERLNVLAEQGPRIGTYILKADTKGLTGLEAAVKGRDVTVDFSKAGNIVKLVNQAIPFLNAGVQGSANTARLVRYDPNGAIVRAAPLAVGTIAVWLNNQRFETAKMIPDYEYAYSWPIIIGEGTRERDPKYPNAQPEKFPIYIKVPKGPMVAALIAPVELGLRLAWANDDRSVVEHFLEAGRTTAMAMSPIEPSVSALTPPLLSTGLSVGANYDFFRDQPIVPRGEQERPPELQYGAETSKTAVALGEQFKVSPRLIEFAIRDYTGGVGQQGLWMLDMALGALGYDPQVPGEAKKRPLSKTEQLAKTPGVSRFLGTRNTQEDKLAWEQFDKAVEQSQRKFATVQELKRLGMNLGPVGDTISIADNVKIRLDPRERAELQLMTGNTLTVLATQLSGRPAYSKLPDYLKTKVMQSVLNKGREAVRKRYLNQLSSSDVKQRVREAFPLAVGQ